MRSPRWLRPRTLVAANPALPRRVGPGTSAAVVGGGVAGCVAATVLAERGVQVTLLEAQAHLGGRAGAWKHTLPGGETLTVGHGFHAFFRQYYNLRAWLRRLDPDLAFLTPVPDYPVVSPHWPSESFAGLPRLPLVNLALLCLRSPSLTFGDLRRMDGRAAARLLAFDRTATYRDLDLMPAAALLDSLRLPDRARAMLFEVFSHSFFNDEREMSAAEMVMMFHFYFLGNPEGLLFDAPRDHYDACLWGPARRLLDGLGVELALGRRVTSVAPAGAGPARWWVTAGGSRIAADHVILALDPGALRELVAGCAPLGDRAPRLAAQAGALRPTRPYVVARYYTTGDLAPARPAFCGLARSPVLDAIALLHRLEGESAAWARRHRGAVVELHSYRVPEGTDPAARSAAMWRELVTLWPEAAGLEIRDTTWRLGTEAPGFGVGTDAQRPGVATDAPGLSLAGDWVRIGFPAALMERAAATGLLAANRVLAEHGCAPEPVLGIPQRGLLAGPARAGSRAR